MLLARFSDSRLLAAFLLVLYQVWTGAVVGVCLAADEDPEASEPAEAINDAGDILVEDDLPSTALLFDDPSATTERIDVAASRERYADLGALLDDLAGVRVTSFGGIGRSASVSLRGSSGKQVLVLLDGVPLNAAGEAFDLSTIPLDQLDVVEITKGNASALYGGGAVGGVINLVPRSATSDDSTAGGALRLQAGSELTTGATLTGWDSEPGEPLLWQLQTEHTRGEFRFLNDNGTAFNQADDYADRRFNNESHSTGFLARQSWSSDSKSRSLTATINGFWRTRGEPGIVTFPSPTSDQRESRLMGDLTWRLSDLLAPSSETEFRLFGRYGQTIFQDPKGEQTGTPISSQQATTLSGLRAGTVIGVGEDWLWTLLLEGTHEELHDQSPQLLEGGGDHTRTSLGIGLRGEWTLQEHLTLVGALRGDLLSDQPDRLSPRLGLVWEPDDAWTFRASAGNAYRPPSFTELSDSRGFVVGNPDLRPEVSRSFELSAGYDTDEASFEAALFLSDTRDLIEYVQLGGFRFKPLNFGRAQARGLELAGELPLNDAWTLSGAWTLQEVTDETGGANRDGAEIPGRPNQFGQLTLQWQDGDWESVISANHVGRNSVTLANTKQLDARDTLDWSCRWRFGPETISLQIANLLDASAADLRGFPLPGQTWLLAYTHTW